ncbi:hypothetical protein HDF16_003471 [Granulicella aggregans]|uniref:Uncharacterized protein n=1 Tax=Granulicella aggregans TaxID=474949 RepID=A0A7W8E4L1_9BACT|nr:DUF2339 domain-containing protein [Granulicella aggregans]MBB5058757.1 hypothetical protein [Granulicella aggregans]
MAIPAVAIGAWIKAGNLRQLVEEQSNENQRNVSDLKREIATLRRSLEVVNEKLAATANRSVGTPDEVIPPTSAVVKATPNLAFAHSMPTEQTSQQAPKIVPPGPPVHLKQENPVPQALPAIQAAAPVVESATILVPPTPVAVPPPAPAIPGSANTVPPPFVAPPATARVAAPRVSLQTPQPPAQPRPSSFNSYKAAEPRVSVVDWLRTKLPLEEVLGMNLFAKIGIVLLVLGFALLGRVALISMGPAGKVALLYAAASALLGGGIWLERKERYALLGRTGIGGGWALAFFTTYAMNHVQAMKVMSSETLNCVFLLGVAIAIAAHTLRYKSQLITGLSFLLAFSTIALTQDTVYALSAGLILAVGIVGVALRMGWYELEVFGILASFSNHFYWLYRLYPNGVAGHDFPQLLPSSIILVLYWLIFRISYVVRAIPTPRDERISTIAALANTILLLSVMKFQSTRPELAAYALLALGAMEFIFGQLPVTRRRRPAFILLTVLGTMLISAAVPFKFSGNSIAVVWMIGAEALLIAGIVQREVVFRRLGLIAGTVTGLLVAYEARTLFELRQHAQTPLVATGIQLLLCAALFYINAHFVRERWRGMFEGIDEQLAEWQSYLGAAMAFLGVWALFPADGTAVGWAVLMTGAAAGTRLLPNNRHLLAQAWILSVAVAVRMAVVNCHVTDVYPHHVTARLITLPLLALIFYLTAAVISAEQELRIYLRSFTLLAGTSALVALVWFEVSPDWVACGWLGLTVGLYLTSRSIKLDDLCWQGHVLAGLVTADLLLSNLDAKTALARYLPIVLSAIAFYAVSRFCTLQNATYKREAAWAHTWLATGLLATLAWHEAQQPWLAVLWVAFALTLALVDRFFDIEELPWQAHTLATLAVVRAATLNLYVLDKWHGVDLRLITLSILVAVLYALAYCVRLPQTAKEEDLNHIYSWAASIFGAWMLWSELQSIAVADGLAIFGLLLFEFGDWRKQRQIRLQGYVALTIGFARIFFVNLTAATLPGETISPRIYTIIPIAFINLFVWMQLQSGKEKDEVERFSIANLLAWFATGSVASLLYFEVSSEWIVLSWAILAIALLLTVLTIDKELFLQQAILLVTAVVTRGIAHNIFGSSYFSTGGWKGNIAVLSFVIALLFAGLPIAFRLRTRYNLRPMQFRLSQALALNRPEQWLFFAPILLLTLMIVVKLNSGMVTLAWGLEGLMVVLLGLRVGERTYRITGLLLLLVCVCKIVFRDAWQLSERDRYITFIALGAALMLVSTLYNRFRESVRRLL